MFKVFENRKKARLLLESHAKERKRIEIEERDKMIDSNVRHLMLENDLEIDRKRQIRIKTNILKRKTDVLNRHRIRCLHRVA